MTAPCRRWSRILRPPLPTVRPWLRCSGSTRSLELDEELTALVASLSADLQQLAAEFPGCEVEVKPVGAAFHCRNAVAHELRGWIEADAVVFIGVDTTDEDVFAILDDTPWA